MIPIDYELGKRIVDTCECECGGRLNLPWGGSYGVDGPVIICSKDPAHDTVVPIKSFTKMWRDGEELPPFIKANIERRHKEEMMEQENVKAMVVKADAAKLSVYVKAKFPKDLEQPGAALDFARWCIAHQLEPIRDCIPFQGTPYICVEWLDRQATADEKFKGYSYKVFGKAEKEALVFDPLDLVIECQANWDGLDAPLIGLGVVSLEEREKKTERGTFRSPIVATHAQQMAFKRARSAALKQRYHIPAPILEELPYTTVIEAEYKVLHDEPAPDKTEPVVAAESGDSAEAGQESEEEEGGGAGETVPATTEGEGTKNNREASAARRTSDQITPEDVPDGYALEKVANEVWGCQPKQVWAELHYPSVRHFEEAGVDSAWNGFLTMKSARG